MPKDNQLSAAMEAVDLSTSDVEEALSEPIGKPAFNTHSTSLAGEFEAKGKAIISQVAEVDAKMALLSAEREDLMLAYSMLSHGLRARETR